MTAVEWLVIQLHTHWKNEDVSFEKLIEQAKAMEKEQIIDAFWTGDNTDCIAEQNAKEFAEKYYTETYKLK